MNDMDPLTQEDRDAITSCGQCAGWMAASPEFDIATFRIPPDPPPDETIVARVHRRTIRDGISHAEAVRLMWWRALMGRVDA